MGNISFLLKTFKVNKIKNLLIVIQIMISVFFCTFFLMPITKSIEINLIVDKMELKDNVAFLEEANHISGNSSNYNGEKYKILREYIKNIDGVKNIGGVKSVGSVYSSMIDIGNPSVIIYDKEICRILKHPLSNGEWFSECIEIEEGVIPVVISSKLQKIYSLNSQFEISIVKSDNSSVSLKCKVIGVLKKNAYIYLGGSNHSDQSLSDLFTKTENEEFVIMPNFFKELNIEPMTFAYRGMLIECDNFEKVAAKVEEDGIGKLYSLEDLKENDINNVLIYNEQKIYEFIIIFVFILISISGYNTLANLEYKRLLTIYYITGMTWKRGIALLTIRNFILIMLPTVISSILSNLIVSNLRTLYPFDEINILVTMLLYLIIFFTTTFITILNLRKQKPIEILREVD